MTIEIGGVPGKAIQDAADKSNVSTTRNSNSNQGAPATTSSSGGSDTISLTASAVQLRELEEKVANLPVVDVQRVSDVQRAMATGTLEVSEADAANNLLEIEKSFS
ncbi:MAG: flagellar biosynthesis anti-sigma factor FlgM [Gammaproteobacteria bacterium]|nr:flagellar biosynthesis anti-sigma factor FlgM [Gammaproteobacteria bacterium]